MPAAKPLIFYFIGLMLAVTAFSAGPQEEPTRPKAHGIRANDFQAPMGEPALQAANGQVCFHKPVAYQHHTGSKHSVDVRYVLTGKNHVGFGLRPYDSKETLIIDPVLSYSTFDWGKTWGF